MTALWDAIPIYSFVLVIIGIFFGVLIVNVGQNLRMFTRRYGRRHRISGLVYLIWLLLGYADLYFGFLWRLEYRFIYDFTLPTLGTILTLTAAFDFKDAHSRVQNIASGVLDNDAVVTFSEMLEHSFYQILNAIQIAFLVVVTRIDMPAWCRGIVLLCATAPWLLRHRFPVNHFSDNYTKEGRVKWALTSILYRLKKYQYLLYKHCLLHGLNITVAADAPQDLLTDRFFRLYWMALNTAYVMEFFLQTLVRRRYMSQTLMLLMNQGAYDATYLISRTTQLK